MLGTVASVTQGSSGLALGYAAVAAPMAVAMVRNGASLKRLLTVPIYAAAVTVAAGVGLAAASSLGTALGLSLGGAAISTAVGAAATISLGYVSGRFLAKPASTASEHRRGTVVLDNEPATHTRPHR